VIGRGMRLVAIGISIGVAASIGLTRLIATLLFGTGAVDTLTLAGSAIVFFAVALTACYMPARKATRVETASVLRTQ